MPHVILLFQSYLNSKINGLTFNCKIPVSGDVRINLIYFCFETRTWPLKLLPVGPKLEIATVTVAKFFVMTEKFCNVFIISTIIRNILNAGTVY